MHFGSWFLMLEMIEPIVSSTLSTLAVGALLYVPQHPDLVYSGSSHNIFTHLNEYWQHVEGQLNMVGSSEGSYEPYIPSPTRRHCLYTINLKNG